MRIEIIAVGKRMPGWVDEAFGEYRKRFDRSLEVSLKEVDAIRRSASITVPRAVQEESERLAAAVAPGNQLICLDERGQSWSTRQLSKQLDKWMHSGRNVSLLVGGADGMSDQLLHSAERTWSLSALTLPHPLVRVILIEQLYRGWSLLQNLPYHRS